MNYLLQVVETYRVDNREEVDDFISQEKKKAQDGGYELKSYSTEHKEKKAKGEIIDDAEMVKLTKVYGNFWEV